MKICQKCNSENTDDSKFCSQCGSIFKVERKCNLSPWLTLVLIIFAVALFIGFSIRKGNKEQALKPSPTPTVLLRSDYSRPSSTQDFYTYPDKYKSKKVKLVDCVVFNIVSTNSFQCHFGSEPIMVETIQELTDLYKNDVVTIYGIGKGKACGKNAFGAEICQPKVDKAFFDKK